MKTKLSKIISFLVCVVLLLSRVNLSIADEPEKIKIVIWSFTPELEMMVEQYYMPNHPEIEFSFHMEPTSDYPGALDNQMESAPVSDDAPDIFALEAAFVKKYVDSNYTGDLSAINISKTDYADVYPAIVEIGKSNITGEQKALSWQACPVVIFYRASLAEKYLGVKSPDEFQRKVKDYSSFLSTARELNEASEGVCKIITGINDIHLVGNDQWIQDSQLNVSDKMISWTQLCKTLYDENLTRNAASWTETWRAGMRGEVETLIYVLPTWGLNYTLKPSCIPFELYAENDEELKALSEEHNGTYGDWRMVNGPFKSNWGGTWIATNRAKVNQADSAKKAAIKDIMTFFTLDKNFLSQYTEDTGDFTSSITVNEQVDLEMEFLGGQNPFQVFDLAGKETHARNATEYDSDISDLWVKTVVEPYTRGESSLEDAIEQFRIIVAQLYPDFPDYISLSLCIGQDDYQETFVSENSNRFFVLPLSSQSQAQVIAVQSSMDDQLNLSLSGECFELQNGILTPIKAGTATITAWLTRNDEEIENTRTTGSILVIDPSKTITLPAFTDLIEAEAFEGTAAECLIIPSGTHTIEKDTFSNCPNLKYVILLGNHSGLKTADIFTSPASILFLSNDGTFPANFNATQTGITSYSGE